MKVIGYIRVSTQDQATEGVSLEAQRSRIEAWALSNNYQMGAIYEDAGLSGSSMDKRPALQQALTASVRGTVLVAYSMSRFARSTKDMLSIAERLQRQGAELASLTEKIDTTSAAGRMVFRMLAVLAEFERDLTSERTKTALALLKSKGVRLGSPNPHAGGEATRALWEARRRSKNAIE